MQWWTYVIAGLFWVLVVIRWRYGRRVRRKALLAATGGFSRDMGGRGGF